LGKNMLSVIEENIFYFIIFYFGLYYILIFYYIINIL